MPETKSETAGKLVIDTRTGQRGDEAAWIAAFKHVWEAPRERLDRLMALLGPDIVLKAPTQPPKTVGQAAGRQAFERALRAMPDLRAEIIRWGICEEALFVEMTFRAKIGPRQVAWRSVDRILFCNGIAIERVAHFDPAPIRRAFLSSPSGILQYLRIWLGP